MCCTRRRAKCLCARNEIVDEAKLVIIEAAKVQEVFIRSPLTCEMETAFANCAMAATWAVASWWRLGLRSALLPRSPSVNPARS